jgi:uncharacterized damage-inducible protein DinB
MARPRRPARRAWSRRLRFSPADARSLVAYNRAVFERFVRRIQRLPAKEVLREREIGHHTLLGTLVHILNVHEAWLVYIVPGRVRELRARFRDPDRHPTTWAGFRDYSSRVWEGVERTAKSLGPLALGRIVRAPWMRGHYTVRDALLQTTLEEAHHLGEVIGALWQIDAEPPPMTWIEVRRGRAP